MGYKEIAQELITLKKVDLELRNLLIARNELSNGYNPVMEALHVKNAKILERIINLIGFPSKDKVGNKGFEAAWTVVQHAISLPRFMKKCAQLLEEVALTDKEIALPLACLKDRIAVFENKPQLHGTQFDWDQNGVLSPYEVDHVIAVNDRRKKLGLNSLEEQTVLMRKQAALENQIAPADFKLRQLVIDKWKKKVGWIS